MPERHWDIGCLPTGDCVARVVSRYPTRVPVDAHDPLGRRDRHEHDPACLGDFPQPLALGHDTTARTDAEKRIGGQPVVRLPVPSDARVRP